MKVPKMISTSCGAPANKALLLMCSDKTIKKVENLGYWVAAQYEISGGDQALSIRKTIDLIINGKEGERIYFSGDPLKYEDAKDYLYNLVSHPRGLQDLIPKHISPSVWQEKLMELAHVIKKIQGKSS